MLNLNVAIVIVYLVLTTFCYRLMYGIAEIYY